MPSLVIPAPARMLTLNAERKMSTYERAAIVRLWREAAWVYARSANMRPMDTVHVTADIEQKGSVLADAGAHFPCVKAIIDGLVDAKVLPDDGPAHVLSLRQFAAARAAENTIMVTLTDGRLGDDA